MYGFGILFRPRFEKLLQKVLMSGVEIGKTNNKTDHICS